MEPQSQICSPYLCPAISQQFGLSQVSHIQPALATLPPKELPTNPLGQLFSRQVQVTLNEVLPFGW